MNMRLVLLLSLLGVLVAAVSVAGFLKTGMETACWAAIAILSSLVLARQVPGKYFLHGFLALFIATMLSMVLQAAFMNAYLANNPGKLDALKRVFPSIPPAVTVLVSSPFAASINGVMAGLLTWLASKFIPRKAA